jgi:hypothetical protein
MALGERGGLYKIYVLNMGQEFEGFIDRIQEVSTGSSLTLFLEQLGIQYSPSPSTSQPG